MRLWSTPESVRKGEITVLAVAETIAAMGISLWIAWRYETVAHIAISAAIAPFLLLRTPLARRYGLVIADKWLDSLWKRSDALLLILAAPPLVSLCSRIYSIFRNLLRAFKEALITFPVNWFKANFAVDFRQSPELFIGAQEFCYARFIRGHLYNVIKEIFEQILLQAKERSVANSLFLGCLLLLCQY